MCQTSSLQFREISKQKLNFFKQIADQNNSNEVFLPIPACSLGLLKSCIVMLSVAGTTAKPLSSKRASPFPFELPLGLNGARSDDSSRGTSSAFLPNIRLHKGEVKKDSRRNSSLAYSMSSSQMSNRKKKKNEQLRTYIV